MNRRGWLGTALVLMACAASQSRAEDPAGPTLSPEEAWEQRIVVQLERLELELAALDKTKPAPPPQLHRRVTAAHDRLVGLEKKAMLAPGTIKGQWDLGTISADVASLHTRVRAVIDSRAPKPKVAPTAPPPALPKPDPAPEAKPPPGRQWPLSLQFKATAKIVYQETGEWFISKGYHSGLGYDFLMDGYSGVLSFSLSSTGLKEDIASASLRVVVTQKFPFSYDSETYWVYDLSWAAEGSRGVFGNDSLKHFVRYATVSSAGPIEWISKPKEVTLKVSATAYVLAVRLKSGEEIAFDTPEYSKKR